MTRILNVSGIHCDACSTLIKMELGELGIDEGSVSVRVDGLNQNGIVTLRDIDVRKTEQAIEAINSMEGYQVE